MHSNFNTAPTWGQNTPDQNGWAQPTTGGYASNAWETAITSPSPDEWGSASALPSSVETGWDSHDNNVQAQPESGATERLSALKDKMVHGIGRRALDAVMNRLPSFGGKKDTLQNAATNLYENPTQLGNYAQQANEAWNNRASFAGQSLTSSKQVGREVAGAGLGAAKETVRNYYGLEKDENEKLRIAKKLKFGKAVVKTVLNPIGTATSVGTRAAMASRKAVKQEAVSQFKSMRENFTFTPEAAYPNVPNSNGW